MRGGSHQDEGKRTYPRPRINVLGQGCRAPPNTRQRLGRSPHLVLQIQRLHLTGVAVNARGTFSGTAAKHEPCAKRGGAGGAAGRPLRSPGPGAASVLPRRTPGVAGPTRRDTALPRGRHAHTSPKPPPKAPLAASVTSDGRQQSPKAPESGGIHTDAAEDAQPGSRDRGPGFLRRRRTEGLRTPPPSGGRGLGCVWGGTEGRTPVSGRSEEPCPPPACAREPPGVARRLPTPAGSASHKGFAPRPPRDASSPGRRHLRYQGHVAQRRTDQGPPEPETGSLA